MNTENLNFTEIDTSALLTQILNRVEQATGEPLYPGDERRIFAEGVTYALAVFINAANVACRDRLLKYASGYVLDALGERVDCRRLSPIPAKTTLKFSLAIPRTTSTIIPSGTRVTADNTVFFATDVSATIPPGALTIEVSATATIGGMQTNGIPVGTVQSFVDDVPFVVGVTNLTESSGADAGEPYPQAIDTSNGDNGTGDNHYRERIALAPSAFSSAGPSLAYEYYAKSANAHIADVKVLSEQEAGSIEIYVLMDEGLLPSQEILDEVGAKVSADDVRPLGDKVTVLPPEEVEYSIDITYYTLQENESETKAAIEGAGGAIDQYKQWQSAAIGRDINPDKLRSLCLDHVPRLDVVAPVFTTVSDSQVARWNGEIHVNYIINQD